MKKFKAVIFDMDGTIVDTAGVWINANTLFLLKHNIFSEKLLDIVNTFLHGIPVIAKINEFKEICGLAHLSDNLIINDYNDCIEKSYETEINYIIHCEEFIAQLVRQHIPIAIATNSSNYGIERVAKIINIKHYFKNHIYGIECVGNRAKPHPDIFSYAARQLGFEPTDCIVFEDSIHGVTAAKHSGMFTIAINTAKIKDKLVHADKIINCYSEIDLKEYF
jgi:HAD superfamily hydrolase (TIGR01509 family)